MYSMLINTYIQDLKERSVYSYSDLFNPYLYCYCIGAVLNWLTCMEVQYQASHIYVSFDKEYSTTVQNAPV